MRRKILGMILLLALVAMAAQARADGWIPIGTYTAQGIDSVEADAKAEAEATMAGIVAAIASLYPGADVEGIVDTEEWDSPIYEIHFTVYLRIF